MAGDFGVDITRQRRVGISMSCRADGASPSRNGNRRQEEPRGPTGIKLEAKSGAGERERETESATESNLASGRREFTSSYVNACVTSACE